MGKYILSYLSGRPMDGVGEKVLTQNNGAPLYPSNLLSNPSGSCPHHTGGHGLIPSCESN